MPGNDVRGTVRTLGVAALVTALVGSLGWFAPAAHQATLIGLVFLGATWWLGLRGGPEEVRSNGLSLGGILEPSPLDLRRLVADSLRAIGAALAVALVVFPPFAVAWKWWWRPTAPWTLSWHAELPMEALGQISGIALPEEAFYRGWLQSKLDRCLPPRHRFLGADVGLGLLVSSGVFALGHFATDPRADRLAVFFPSLLFGWLRARTGGIGAPLVLHGLANLLTWWLAKSMP